MVDPLCSGWGSDTVTPRSRPFEDLFPLPERTSSRPVPHRSSSSLTHGPRYGVECTSTFGKRTHTYVGAEGKRSSPSPRLSFS